MKNFFDDKLKFRQQWGGSVGQYGILNSSHIKNKEEYFVMEWVQCREQFLARRVSMFAFNCAKNGKRLAHFVGLIEAKVGVKKKDRTTFHTTSNSSIIIIKRSPWWNTSIRKSLFNNLLRCGLKYRIYKNNFEEALYSERYLKDTKPAVERFFQGYTKSKSRISGWYSQFSVDGWGVIDGVWRQLTKEEIESKVKKKADRLVKA